MRSATQWQRFRTRPITDADVGRFVIGRGYGRWIGGVVAKSERNVCIDTGHHGMPLGGYMDANAVRVYAFLDPPPASEDRP